MNRKMTMLVVVSSAMLVVGAGALYQAHHQPRPTSAISKKAAEKLPSGTTAMAAAEQADFTGKAICGSCSWDIGESCNTMLWDKDGHHVAALLPNEKLAELQKLTGT